MFVSSINIRTIIIACVLALSSAFTFAGVPKSHSITVGIDLWPGYYPLLNNTPKHSKISLTRDEQAGSIYQVTQIYRDFFYKKQAFMR